MTRPPSPAHLAYLRQRVELAERALKVAIGLRLGATVVKRRRSKLHLAVAELEKAAAAHKRIAA